MKVKDLVKMLKEVPQDAEVVFASDEEGNSFHAMSYSPTEGKFDDEDGEFLNKPNPDDEDYQEQLAEYNNFPGKKAVCIN